MYLRAKFPGRSEAPTIAVGLFSNGLHIVGGHSVTLFSAGEMVWLCSGVEIMTPSAWVILLYMAELEFSSHLRSWLNRECYQSQRISSSNFAGKNAFDEVQKLSVIGNLTFEPTIDKFHSSSSFRPTGFPSQSSRPLAEVRAIRPFSHVEFHKQTEIVKE